MRSLLPLTMFELRSYLSNRAAILWSFVMPIVVLLIFGSIFNKPSTTNLSLKIELHASPAALQNFLQQELSRVPSWHLCETEDHAVCPEEETIDILIPESPDKPSELIIQSQTEHPGIPAVSAYTEGLIAQYLLGELGHTHPKAELRLPTSDSNTGFQYTYIQFIVTGLAALSILSVSLFGTGVATAQRNEAGNFATLKLWPIPAWTVLSAITISRLVILLIWCPVFVLLALLITSETVSFSVVDWLGFELVVLALSFPLMSISLVIAFSIKRAATMVAIANLLYFVLLLFSDLILPSHLLPSLLSPLWEWGLVGQAAGFLREFLFSSNIAAIPLISFLLISLLTGVVFHSLASRQFRNLVR